MQLSENMRGVAFMCVAMAAFTANDALMKSVTQTVPLMQAIALRGAITIVALLVLARAMGGVSMRVPRGRDGRLLAIRTLAELAATLSFLSALMYMPLANLAAILQSLPLAVTLAAALVFGEAVGWRRMLAICVGFAGVLLIIRPGTEGFDIWSVVGVVSVACVVVRDLATRRFSASLPSVMIALVTALAVTGMGVAGALLPGAVWVAVSLEEGLRLAMAAIAVVLGYVFVIKAMRSGDVAMVAPFRYTSLVWAIGLGWLMFGDLPDPLTWVGSGLVVASGLFTLWREARLARRAT